MPELKTYKLFISHAWAYGDEYNRIISILNQAPRFQYWNYSAPKENPLKNLDGSAVKGPYQIADAIDRKIRPVNCVLVLSGMYAAHREWMQYEIDAAVDMGKPIIGVIPRGGQRIPKAVRDAAEEMVCWRWDSIVPAVRHWSL